MSSKIVRPYNAFETETVRIKWTLKDGTFCYTNITCPPKATREARVHEDEIARMADEGCPHSD